MNESVTIVIPAWNAEAFINRALDSVFAQTRKPEVLVVVDDGSTDGTWLSLATRANVSPEHPAFQSLVDGVEFCAIRKPHTNLPGTRNAGIRATFARTTIFGFLDADDWYSPRKIECSLEAFAKHTAIGCVTSDYTNHHPNALVYREYKPPFDAERLLCHCIHNINCFVRQRAFQAMGGLFDENLTYVEDYDLFLRLSEVGLIYHIPESLHNRSVHSSNMSLHLGEMVRYEQIVKQKMIARRQPT